MRNTSNCLHSFTFTTSSFIFLAFSSSNMAGDASNYDYLFKVNHLMLFSMESC